MKKIAIIFLTIAMALLVGSPMADAKVKNKRRATTQKTQQAKLPANINELMQAPYVTPNKDGFINRKNAPQNNSNLKATTYVKNDGNSVVIKIYIKDKLMQTFNSSFNFPDEGFSIYYLDINYDGYNDIYILANTNPYGGTLILLWNPDLKKFEISYHHFECTQFFSLQPANKTINFYYLGGACMGEYQYEKCVFKNSKFEVIDELVELPCDDGSSYYYIGLGCNNKIDYSKELANPKGLPINSVPQEWQNIMNSFKK